MTNYVWNPDSQQTLVRRHALDDELGPTTELSHGRPESLNALTARGAMTKACAAAIEAIYPVRL